MTRNPTWRLSLGLLLLGAIPIVSGTLRVVEFLGGPATMPERTSFEESPATMVVHIVASLTFVALGTFQFSAGIRRRLGWHPVSGRLLVPLGLAAALSALWMNEFYELPDGPNALLYVFRLVFASAMATSILLGCSPSAVATCVPSGSGWPAPTRSDLVLAPRHPRSASARPSSGRARPGSRFAIEAKGDGRLVGDLATKVDANEPREMEVRFTLAAEHQGTRAPGHQGTRALATPPRPCGRCSGTRSAYSACI
ncbi:MAG TPA: DUF2306 domain-containing protein [Ardenticatenaceae bacterium]|nr:DUF2306 domain-containing protein [Ardenticatenaceae bacterium]